MSWIFERIIIKTSSIKKVGHWYLLSRFRQFCRNFALDGRVTSRRACYHVWCEDLGALSVLCLDLAVIRDRRHYSRRLSAAIYLYYYSKASIEAKNLLIWQVKDFWKDLSYLLLESVKTVNLSFTDCKYYRIASRIISQIWLIETIARSLLHSQRIVAVTLSQIRLVCQGAAEIVID